MEKPHLKMAGAVQVVMKTNGMVMKTDIAGNLVLGPVLTNCTCQSNDHLLACGLIRDTTHHSLDAIHPDLQLHHQHC